MSTNGLRSQHQNRLFTSCTPPNRWNGHETIGATMSAQPLAHESHIDSEVLRAADRAMADLRRGSELLLHGPDGTAALIQAAEGVSDASLAQLSGLSGTAPLLVLTQQRASTLGIPAAEPNREVVTLGTANLRAETVAELADPTTKPGPVPAEHLAPAAMAPDVEPLAEAAVALAKMARLLPAVLIAPVRLSGDPAAWAAQHKLLAVSALDIAAYRYAAARALRIVADARVPLAGAENTRIVAFRPTDGGVEHLAIVIGSPALDQPVLTRLHSECFTGDLLGSLRCDCGDQLRGAIQAIAEAGAGILLYLAQEGRGIGLVNKLRAYDLQDRGADTFEANEQLGFDADERVYLPAAEMLRRLGYQKIRLMTNNPDKVAGVVRYGITVAERVAHSFPSNGHNELYLAAKATRGHLI